jgi:predicted  nucleic acid-binding Zn-ribbon protein
LPNTLDILTLQGLDDETTQLQATLADVERHLHGDSALNEARERFASADGQLSAARQEQRRLDAAIQDLTARIDPEEKRLYGGTVSSAKELTTIQHEVELLKEQRAKHEDALLEVLARLEAAEGERADALRQVEQREMRRAQDVEGLRAEADRLNAAITRVQAKRVAEQTKVDTRTLALYEDLRRRKGGHAVARIQGGSCSGCRIALPDAVRRRAMSPAQLAQCPNCERILVVG